MCRCIYACFLMDGCIVYVLSDAKNPGASTATAVIRRKMEVGEAYQILNVERRAVLDKAEVEEVRNCPYLIFDSMQ